MVFNFHFVFKIKIQLIQFINNSSDKKKWILSYHLKKKNIERETIRWRPNWWLIRTYSQYYWDTGTEKNVTLMDVSFSSKISTDNGSNLMNHLDVIDTIDFCLYFATIDECSLFCPDTV